MISTKRHPMVPASFVQEQLSRRAERAARGLARGASLPKLLDEAYAAYEAESFLGRFSECFSGLLQRGRRQEKTPVAACGSTEH